MKNLETTTFAKAYSEIELDRSRLPTDASIFIVRHQRHWSSHVVIMQSIWSYFAFKNMILARNFIEIWHASRERWENVSFDHHQCSNIYGFFAAALILWRSSWHLLSKFVAFIWLKSKYNKPAMLMPNQSDGFHLVLCSFGPTIHGMICAPIFMA